MSIIYRLTLIVCILLVLPVNSTFAADGKTYPGTICQYWTAPDENAKRSRFVVSQFGWVGNDPAADFRIGVVCPIIRDSQRGGGIERVMIRGFHPNCPPGNGNKCPGKNECTLRIMSGLEGPSRRKVGPQEMARWNDASPRTVSDGVFATLLSGFTNISIPDFTNSGDPSQGSTIVLFCRIEPGVRINFIYVGEKT